MQTPRMPSMSQIEQRAKSAQREMESRIREHSGQRKSSHGTGTQAIRRGNGAQVTLLAATPSVQAVSADSRRFWSPSENKARQQLAVNFNLI